MIPEIDIDDKFYILYSFVHDFGYAKQDEILSIMELLKENGIEPDEENVTKALEYIRDILLILNEEYSEELDQYKTLRIERQIVSGDVPLPIRVAKQIFRSIISVGERVISALRGKDEDEKMIDKIIKIMEKDHEDIVVAIKKTYSVKRTGKNDT